MRRKRRMEPRVIEIIENRRKVHSNKMGFEVARPETRVPTSYVSFAL